MAAAAAPRGIFHPPKLHTGTSTPADPPAFLVDELAGLVDLDGRPLKANQWYYAETRGNWRCFGLRSAQFPDGRPEPIGLYCGILTGNVWTADGALMKDLQAVILELLSHNNLKLERGGSKKIPLISSNCDRYQVGFDPFSIRPKIPTSSGSHQ